MLSQIPPQTVYAGAGCTAPLPDYRNKVVASDNCIGTIVITQTPIPGTMLTATNPAVTVVLTAKDAFGNTSKPLNVSVTLIDTIAPILTWPVGQINMTDQDLINVYKNWEAGVKIHGIAKWMYDRKWQNGLVLADTTIIDSCSIAHRIYPEGNLKYFTNIVKLTDEEYAQYISYVEANK
jgi:hypothetical protein